MHILLLSLYYVPEPVARPHDLATTLCKLGHRVSVITAFPNYPEGKIYPNYRMCPWRWDEVDGIKILRVPHLIDRSRSAVRRLLSYFSFALSACLGMLKVKKPDVIWTYQIGLPGVIMSVLWGVPMVHEVQDLWPEWGHNAEIGLKSWLYRLLDWQEHRIYRHARAVVTITGSFKKILVQKGVPSDKIAVIPNWVNEANFHPMAYDLELAQKEDFVGHFNVIYVGNVGTAQSLQVVLDAAELLRNDLRVRFVIIGDGVERASLEVLAWQRGLENVRFLGSRPQDQVARYMALADVLFLHLKRDPVYEVTIPSKTYGYLASGKPILAAAEGELADLIREQHAGIVCRPENAAALAEAVIFLVDLPAAQQAEMGQAGRRAVAADYSRETLGNLYAELFEKIAGKV